MKIMLSKTLVLTVIVLFIGASVFVPSILGFGTGNEDNGDKQRDWEIETVDSAGDTGWCTSIALDSNDYPHISYGDDWDTLKYAKWNGATWDIETVDSPGFGWTSIALDSNDYPHIAYPNQDDEYQKYAKWNGATWDIEIVDPVWSYYASIALDSNDYPHISYCEMNNKDLKYAKWNGATWDIETVDSAGNVGEYCSLALDSSEYPHISYRDKDNDALKHAWWDGTIWHIETVEVIPGSYNVRYTSIAIDSNDKSHIAYKDYESDDLKYAKNTTGTWQTEIVDSTGDTGWYLSIALDSSDYPHISFSDWPGYNYRLKYAKWNGTEWGIEIVDTAVDAGKFTSIALDSYDCPHISYNDGNLDDLKYAKKTPSNNPPSACYTWVDADGIGSGTTIDFDASCSTDDNGITLYEWDWNDDGSYEYSSSSPTTSHDYGDNNTHDCTLRVTDTISQTDTFTDTVQANQGGDEIIDINQSAFDRGFPIRHALDGDWAAAQSFIPTLNTLTSTEIYMRKFGTPEFNLTAELHTDHPQGALIDTLVFTPAEVPSSWEWFILDFNDVTVTPGVDYFIVIPPAPSGVTTSFGYEWGYAFGNQYDDGAFWFTRDGGGLWRDLPTMYEFVFRTYGYS